MKTKEFKEEVNKIVKEHFNVFTNNLPEEFLKNIESFSTRIHLSDEKFKEFGLDFTDVSLIADFYSSDIINVRSYFKKRKINPVGYYVLPKNYVEASLLGIISEAIKQNTDTPDIKHLQTPNGEPGSFY